MKVYEKLTINIVDVKVLIDWQSPVPEVLLRFGENSSSPQGHWGSAIKNTKIYKNNAIRIVGQFLCF